MQVFGNMYTKKIVCANNAAVDQDFDTIVSSEKLFKIISTKDVFIVLTPKTKSTPADNSDHLIKANLEVEFLGGWEILVLLFLEVGVRGLGFFLSFGGWVGVFGLGVVVCQD